MSRTFGIIGGGMVGGSIAKGLMLDGDVGLYDTKQSRKTAEFEWVVNADFVFVCVPTPMTEVEGGRADLSIMDSVFEQIDKTRKELENVNENSIFIIKSTIPVGTTRKYIDAYDFPVVHCPEFLTARACHIDFLTPSRNIIGGVDEKAMKRLYDFFAERFPGVSVLTMGPEEAEFVKYFCNCFFATKVMFFNEIRLLVDKVGANWQDVLSGTMSDGRIGISHYQVPGHDGDKGFGGLCLPGNAKIKLLGGPGFRDINKGNPRGNNEIISLEELYDNIYNKTQEDRSKYINRETMSFNSTIEEEDGGKVINQVTQREINEELIVFETDQGDFECTQDHYMPIKRNGEFLLIQAKHIKETDELFCIKNSKTTP